MAYNPDVDDVDYLDCTELITYTSTAHGATNNVTALRRPLTHSQERGVQQWVNLDKMDIVFHIEAADLAANVRDAIATTDTLTDADGKTYSVIEWDFKTKKTRLTIIGRET